MTKLHEAALETENLITTLQDQNTVLEQQNERLSREVDSLSDNFVRLQEAAGRALNERDYYMRECAELTAKFTTFTAMAREALETHRMAPFRPNGAAPTDEPANNEGLKAIAEANGMDDAIPAFLTKPQYPHGEPQPGRSDNQYPTPAKIEGPLKLRRKI